MQTSQPHRFNPSNERAKFRYRTHICRVRRRDEKTIIAALKHLRDYEIFTSFAGFETFNENKADKYITHLFSRDLSLSYINDNIRALRDFLTWLERQRGYRSKLTYDHIDYLNISDNQRRTAKAEEYKKSYLFSQIISTIRAMPESTLAQRRNKAIISLQALCGLRINELRTIKMKNLIEEEGHYFVYVSPKDMQVKFAKTREANFINLPEDISQNVLKWRDYLLRQGYTTKDPLFPAIDSSFNQLNLLQNTLTRKHIHSSTTLRKIFQAAFEAAGHVYLNPHRFRHTILRHAEKVDPEYFNAVRLSLGHSSVETSFQSYGKLSNIEKRYRIAKQSEIRG